MPDRGAGGPLPYGAQWLDDDDVAAVVEVLRGAWLTTGPRVAEFEAALAAAAGTRYAVAVSSGTAALHALYAAAGLGREASIVTSPLTFCATATMAMVQGAAVRFADIDPVTGTLDPAAAEAAVAADTRALIAVDYGGHPADYGALRETAAARGIALIADAAHSLGARVAGTPAARLADAAALSFHPVKAVTTAEGGAVVTDDAALAARVRAFRSHGVVRDPNELRHPGPAWHYEVQTLGVNYRIPDVLCALGASQLAKLERFLARRRDLATFYGTALGEFAELELPGERPGVESAWHLYALRVRDAARRDAFFTHLRAHGIGAQVHYLPVYLHPLFADLGYRPGLCPHAEDFAARVVSIPLYPRMTDADATRVVDAVTAARAAVL